MDRTWLNINIIYLSRLLLLQTLDVIELDEGVAISLSGGVGKLKVNHYHISVLN